MSERTALIAGVGASRGLGAALARRFAQEGLQLVIVGRNAGKLDACAQDLRERGATVKAIVGDLTDAALVQRVVAEADVRAALEVAVFNAGGNVPRAFLDMDVQFFEDMWRINAFAGMVFAQAVLRCMAPRRHGSLLFTGATASLRGRPRFAAFASAKAALRALAQSAAREFGPQGVHVAHVIVDGMIDGERVDALWPDARAMAGADGLLDPDAVAALYWMLHTQPRNAWTHELDVRPWAENW
jgi:short-subunit dehydrogenase